MVKTKKINSTSTYEFRCIKCGKLLVRGDHKHIALNIKCSRCGILNSLFKDVADQVIITDADGVVFYANSVLETATGYSLKEVLGKKPSLWGGQMPKEFYKKLWTHLKTKKKPISVTVKNKKKDGTLYNARLHISPVFGIDSEIKMFVGIESIIG